MGHQEKIEIMKNVRIVLVGFAIAALAAACSEKKEDGAATDETEEAAKAAEGADEGAEEAAETDEAAEAEEAAEGGDELEERGMTFMEEVAAAGAENVEDCDAVASSWRTLIDENQDLLDEMRERAQTQTEEEQASFEERYADRLEAFMGEMGEVIQACQGHEEITELVQELSTQ